MRLREIQRVAVDSIKRHALTLSLQVTRAREPDAIDGLALACATGPSGAKVTVVAPTAAEDDGSTGFREKATV